MTPRRLFSRAGLAALVLLGALVQLAWISAAAAQATTGPTGKFASPFTIFAAGTAGQAVSILPGMTATLTNKGTAVTAGESVPAGSAGRIVWLQWTPTTSGDARIIVSSSRSIPTGSARPCRSTPVPR